MLKRYGLMTARRGRYLALVKDYLETLSHFCSVPAPRIAPAMPTRPVLLNILPARLRSSFFARYYQRRGHRWPQAYRHASLRHAPRCFLSNLKPGDYLADSIALTGEYERKLTRRVALCARSGGTFVDVGANLGYFSVIWAAGQPNNRVVAIEASPRNVAPLKANIAANHLEQRVRVITKAAGRRAGTMPFSLGPEDQSGWGGVTLAPSETTVTVEVATLDELLADTQTVDFLKVDIEGADTWALMGAERLLRQRRVREIWYEENEVRMRDLGIAAGTAERFLQACGYRVERCSAAGSLTEWRAVPAR